ncbi:amidase family protein [Psychroserpens sp. BH13MA-6]
MKYLSILALSCLLLCCKNATSEASRAIEDEKEVNASDDMSAISTKPFREFKVLDSKYIDNDALWQTFNADLADFTEATYQQIKPLVMDQDIPTLHKHIQEGQLTYELLTKFYLYRIRKYDRMNPKSLNAVISLNPTAIKDAIAKDEKLRTMDVSQNFNYSVYGMPILLKDNINASGIPTTAGAVALQDNKTNDAFIVKQLKAHDAIILGKVNLSEWAYFFCGDCPSGYSAIGGQTLNPYGRKIIDTGGSSSGSAVAVAANFCAAAIGSETAGSILSPASQNSVVGLKPTIGLVSRSGIVPISSTLDTAGPITRSVSDNAIVLDAIFGEDLSDSKSIKNEWQSPFYPKKLDDATLKSKRFGAFKSLMDDSLYVAAIQTLKNQGAEIIDIEAPEVKLPDFIRLLNLDMKVDLAKYFKNHINPNIDFTTIEDVIAYNQKDSLNRMPYGQQLFYGISQDSSTAEEFDMIKSVLKTNGRQFFDEPMAAHDLDGILSINNYHAGEAAVAEYPAITVPMGYTNEGVPKGLTFIAKPLQEKLLLDWAYVYEQTSKKRQTPEAYR